MILTSVFYIARMFFSVFAFNKMLADTKSYPVDVPLVCNSNKGVSALSSSFFQGQCYFHTISFQAVEQR